MAHGFFCSMALIPVRTGLFFLLVLVSLPIVSSHLEGGIDLEHDGYVIDIGYDTVNISAQHPTVFLLSLATETEEPVETSSAWVRVKNPDGQIMLSMRLFPEPTGSYSFMALFPEEGDYELTLEFADVNGTNETVHDNTVLSVRPDASVPSNSLKNLFYWGLVILFGLVIFGIVLLEKQKMFKRVKGKSLSKR